MAIHRLKRVETCWNQHIKHHREETQKASKTKTPCCSGQGVLLLEVDPPVLSNLVISLRPPYVVESALAPQGTHAAMAAACSPGEKGDAGFGWGPLTSLDESRQFQPTPRQAGLAVASPNGRPLRSQSDKRMKTQNICCDPPCPT